MTVSATPYLDYTSASKPVFSRWILAFADRWRVVLLMFTAAVYLLAFNGRWRIQADSALYLSIGRNMAEGKGFTYLGKPEMLAYPGWPAVIAVTFKAFGSDSLVPIHVVMLLIAAATLAAVYRLVLLHRDRPTAVVVTVGVALTKTFFSYGFELWSDMPFALGVMCFLAGYEGSFPIRKRPSRWYDPTLLVVGLLIATTTRPTGWPLLAAGAAGLAVDAWHRRVSWKLVTVVFAVAAAAVVGMAFTRFGQVYHTYVADVSRDHHLLLTTVGHNLSHLFTVAASDVLFQVRFGDTLNPLLSALMLGLGFCLFRYRAAWGVFFCLLLGIILISQEALDRYFLPVIPLLVLSWWDAVRTADRRLLRPIGGIVFLGLLGFGSIVNLTKVGGIVIQQRTTPFLASFDKGQFDGIEELAVAVHRHADDSAIVLARKPFGRVTAYLSRRTVTDPISTPPTESAGRGVFVIEPADSAIHQWLDHAGLVEGPPLFSTNPGPGQLATTLSIHTTWPVR